MPTKDTTSPGSKQGTKPAATQEYGLYNPTTKSFASEDEMLDPQQRFDNSIQGSETGLDTGTRKREEPREVVLDKDNFGKDFFQFDKDFRDNDNGAPGIDEDYGTTHNALDAASGEELEVEDESMNLEDELPEATDRVVDRP